VDSEVIRLEMTSPDALVPARPSPSAVELQKVSAEAASAVRITYRSVFLPLGSAGRGDWPEPRWADELASPNVHVWLARAKGDIIGLVELEKEPNGDVGIVVLGVKPNIIGNGYGGVLLTFVTQLAWDLVPEPKGGRRVWVQTSSRDHPHAISNYEARGFRRLDDAAARDEGAHG
jgi:GNAT superfamily N-acetyltransferase